MLQPLPEDIRAAKGVPLTGVHPSASSRQAVEEVNRPRSRRVELLVSSFFALTILAITTFIIVAIVIPLCRHQYAGWYNILLTVLAAFALMVSLYVMQIGWGAFKWTRKYREVKDVNWYDKWKVQRSQSSSSSSTDQAGRLYSPQESDVLQWSDVHHFVIVTNYKEPIEMMQLLAYTLMSQRAPGMCKKQITLVLAMEEREGEDAHIKASRLAVDLHPFFKKVICTFHPPDVPGDIKGKASNYKWAVKQVEEYIQGSEGQAAGLQEHMCLVHVADADSLYDPNYFPNVTYHFCVDPKRYDYVWQPCMIPTCNFWELAAPCRQVNTMIAAQEMMSAYDPREFQIPFSTYGYALSTLQLIGGKGRAADAQDGDVIAEDHHLFIKGFFATEGRLKVHPIYLPCLNYAVGGEVQPWCRNIRDRFIQAKRHMFGVSELIFLVAVLCRGKWWRQRKAFGCRGFFRGFSLLFKLTKIHTIPYLGLWVALGIALTGLLSLENVWCQQVEGKLTGRLMVGGRATDDPCDEAITHATKTLAGVCFTFATSLTFIGSFGLLMAFVKMLHATHHTLQNIADPNGSFQSFFTWELSPAQSPNLSFECGPPAGCAPAQDSPSNPQDVGNPISVPRHRPVAVGAGFPWVGTVLQLVVEYVVLGLFTAMMFGTIPHIMAIMLLIFKGHRMEYVTAPKPGTALPRAGTVSLTAVEAEGGGALP